MTTGFSHIERMHLNYLRMLRDQTVIATKQHTPSASRHQHTDWACSRESQTQV